MDSSSSTQIVTDLIRQASQIGDKESKKKINSNDFGTVTEGASIRNGAISGLDNRVGTDKFSRDDNSSSVLNSAPDLGRNIDVVV